MLLDQLLRFLSTHRGTDWQDKSRLALLEWALSDEVGEDPVKAAQDALDQAATLPWGPALEDFMAGLCSLANGLPEPVRRGGARGRRRLATSAMAA